MVGSRQSPRGLDEALDELYGVEPNEFTATRNALRNRLRESGDRDAAAEIARARRPTTAAWALNQLAREHPELVEAVLDETSRLEEAQARARPGQADHIRASSASRRRALDAAADAAISLAGRITANAETHRAPILAALEAASVDPEGAAMLRAGRHARETTGLASHHRDDAVDSATLVAERAGDREAARTELERADGHARETARRADDATAAASDAEKRVAQAQAELDEAKANLRTAQHEARDARATAQELKRSAESATKAMEAARRRLTALEG